MSTTTPFKFTTRSQPRRHPETPPPAKNNDKETDESANTITEVQPNLPLPPANPNARYNIPDSARLLPGSLGLGLVGLSGIGVGIGKRRASADVDSSYISTLPFAKEEGRGGGEVGDVERDGREGECERENEDELSFESGGQVGLLDVNEEGEFCGFYDDVMNDDDDDDEDGSISPTHSPIYHSPNNVIYTSGIKYSSPIRLRRDVDQVYTPEPEASASDVDREEQVASTMDAVIESRSSTPTIEIHSESQPSPLSHKSYEYENQIPLSLIRNDDDALSPPPSSPPSPSSSSSSQLISSKEEIKGTTDFTMVSKRIQNYLQTYFVHSNDKDKQVGVEKQLHLKIQFEIRDLLRKFIDKDSECLYLNQRLHESNAIIVKADERCDFDRDDLIAEHIAKIEDAKLTCNSKSNAEIIAAKRLYNRKIKMLTKRDLELQNKLKVDLHKVQSKYSDLKNQTNLANQKQLSDVKVQGELENENYKSSLKKVTSELLNERRVNASLTSQIQAMKSRHSQESMTVKDGLVTVVSTWEAECGMRENGIRGELEKGFNALRNAERDVFDKELIKLRRKLSDDNEAKVTAEVNKITAKYKERLGKQKVTSSAVIEKLTNALNAQHEKYKDRLDEQKQSSNEKLSKLTHKLTIKLNAANEVKLRTEINAQLLKHENKWKERLDKLKVSSNEVIHKLRERLDKHKDKDKVDSEVIDKIKFEVEDLRVTYKERLDKQKVTSNEVIDGLKLKVEECNDRLNKMKASSKQVVNEMKREVDGVLKGFKVKEEGLVLRERKLRSKEEEEDLAVNVKVSIEENETKNSVSVSASAGDNYNSTGNGNTNGNMGSDSSNDGEKEVKASETIEESKGKCNLKVGGEKEREKVKVKDIQIQERVRPSSSSPSSSSHKTASRQTNMKVNTTTGIKSSSKTPPLQQEQGNDDKVKGSINLTRPRPLSVKGNQINAATKSATKSKSTSKVINEHEHVTGKIKREEDHSFSLPSSSQQEEGERDSEGEDDVIGIVVEERKTSNTKTKTRLKSKLKSTLSSSSAVDKGKSKDDDGDDDDGTSNGSKKNRKQGAVREEQRRYHDADHDDVVSSKSKSKNSTKSKTKFKASDRVTSDTTKFKNNERVVLSSDEDEKEEDGIANENKRSGISKTETNYQSSNRKQREHERKSSDSDSESNNNLDLSAKNQYSTLTTRPLYSYTPPYTQISSSSSSSNSTYAEAYQNSAWMPRSFYFEYVRTSRDKDRESDGDGEDGKG